MGCSVHALRRNAPATATKTYGPIMTFKTVAPGENEKRAQGRAWNWKMRDGVVDGLRGDAYSSRDAVH